MSQGYSAVGLSALLRMEGYHTQGCPDLQPGCPGLTSDGTFSPSALSELIPSSLKIPDVRQEYILSAIMSENNAK
jgi:hypothetical protein